MNVLNWCGDFLKVNGSEDDVRMCKCADVQMGGADEKGSWLIVHGWSGAGSSSSSSSSSSNAVDAPV